MSLIGWAIWGQRIKAHLLLNTENCLTWGCLDVVSCLTNSPQQLLLQGLKIWSCDNMEKKEHLPLRQSNLWIVWLFSPFLVSLKKLWISFKISFRFYSLNGVMVIIFQVGWQVSYPIFLSCFSPIECKSNQLAGITLLMGLGPILREHSFELILYRVYIPPRVKW